MNICFVRIFSIPLALDVKINTPITHRVAWITLTYRVSLTILGSLWYRMQFCKPEPMSFNSRAFGQLPGSRPIYDSPFSFSHQNSVSKTQLHVYSYHLMIRPPRKCHERNQFTNSYYYMNDLSHKVWQAQREYTPELQIIVSYFHMLFFY